MTRYCALSEGVMVIEPNAYYHKGDSNTSQMASPSAFLSGHNNK